MFLIRLAFGLGVAVLFMPTDAQKQAQVYGTLATAVERITTFCDRNPATCRTGAQAWATFVTKAEVAGRMALDLVNDRNRATAVSTADAEPPQQPAFRAPLNQPAALRPAAVTGKGEVQQRRVQTEMVLPGQRGTLRPSDLEPAWRGPAQRRGA
jgi:hypothetical protein